MVNNGYISAGCVSVFIIHSHSKGHDYLLLRRCQLLDAWKKFSKGIKDKKKRADFEEMLHKKMAEAGNIQGTWQMVSGGIEKGEKAYEAAIREVLEETGLTPDRFYSADAIETYYMKSIDKVTFAPVFVAFVDKKKPIKLSPMEHDDFEWVSFEEAVDRLVFAEQKRIITHIHDNFIKKEPHSVNFIEEHSKSAKPVALLK